MPNAAIRRKGARSSARDCLRRMFGLLNKGGAKHWPLSRFHFGGIGTSMIHTVMRQNRMPGVPELLRTAQDLGVKLIACTTTMGLMGISKEILIDGVDQMKNPALTGEVLHYEWHRFCHCSSNILIE